MERTPNTRKRTRKRTRTEANLQPPADLNDDWFTKTRKLRIMLTERNIYTIGDEIHFTGPINQDSIEDVIKELLILLNFKDSESQSTEAINITYIVDSGGGCVSSVFKFVDMLEILRRKRNITFTSIITGTAASAATIMSIVADKRLMTRHASAMIHELSTGSAYKSYTKIKSYNKHLADQHNRIVETYMKYTKKSRDEIEQLLVPDSWYTAEEYLANGFVDELL